MAPVETPTEVEPEVEAEVEAKTEPEVEVESARASRHLSHADMDSVVLDDEPPVLAAVEEKGTDSPQKHDSHRSIANQVSQMRRLLFPRSRHQRSFP